MAKNTNSSSQHNGSSTRVFLKRKAGVVPFVVGLLLYNAGSIWTITTRPWNSGAYYATAAIGLWLVGLLLIGLGLLLNILNTHRFLKKGNNG